MRICIVGAGAMGGLYGGAMAEAGADVTLLDIRQDHVDHINRDGLHITGLTGERHVRLPATDPAAVGKADLVFVQTDINATCAAAESAKAVLADDGCAITLQNGIGNVEIRRGFGRRTGTRRGQLSQRGVDRARRHPP